MFINEIVSEEDVGKYCLDELKKEHDPWAWRNGRPEGFWHAWTVDRDNDIYFYPLKVIDEIGPSGRSEPTNKTTSIICIKGVVIKLIVERVYCSASFADSPFRVVWGVEWVEEFMSPDISKDDLVAVLKEALSVYGYRGAYGRAVAGIVVGFNF